MPGLHDSGVAPPAPRGRGCCCASALCMVVKWFAHPVVVLVIFILIFLGWFWNSSVGSKIALQFVCYAAIVCLCAFTPSIRREKTLSGILLSLLAVVLVIAAASAKRSNAAVVFMAARNFLALALYCIWKLRARGRGAADADAPLDESPVLKEEEEESRTWVQHTTFHIEQLPRRFSYDEIRAVTGDFGTMVGRGGSGEVFRGLLDDGAPVAVKRITGGGKPVAEADFLREVSIVASVHHRSLVRLLGYCFVRGGGGSHCQYLVYPFFENGSLDWWLFNGGEERRRLLPWPTRRRIAVDVARALAYLHHECHRQILHLDVKPANILLDGGLRAHLSDFGVSMSIAQDLTSVDTRGRGTPWYMAPEIWFSSLSTKSDVYSYGMTLLELVGGRRGYQAGRDESPDYLARVVRQKMARGKLMDVVDEAMASSVDEGEVEAVVKVALCCVQHQRELRPSMVTVVDMLEGRVAADLSPESRPLPPVVNFAEPLSSSPVAQNGGIH